MANQGMDNSSALGSGEVQGRFYRVEPYPKLPWYYNNSRLMYAAMTAIVALVIIGVAIN